MMYSQDRRELRQMTVDAWRKAQGAAVLSPLEAQIAQVIEDHPEYQSALGEKDLEASFAAEHKKSRRLTNPFLHMGLHLTIRDQVVTDRPF